MKKFKKIFMTCLLCLLVSIVTVPASVSAAAKLNQKSVTLNVKKSYTLKVTGTKEKITWTTSNKKVATVSAKGVVKAVQKGTATITAKYGKKKLTCKVTVKQPVTSVKLNKKSGNVTIGKQVTLKATTLPTTASNRAVTWKSSNTSVATVTSKGVVTGKKKGIVTITATAKDGSGKKASCKITVAKAAKVTSISLDISKLNIDQGRNYNFVVKTAPASVHAKLQWNSSKPSVATISSTGELTALKNGSTVITVSTKDGSNLKAQCVVTVNNIPTVRKSKVNSISDIAFIEIDDKYMEATEATIRDICGWCRVYLGFEFNYKISIADGINIGVDEGVQVIVIEMNDAVEKFIATDRKVKNALEDARDEGVDVIFVKCTNYNALSRTLEELAKKNYI